MDDRKQQQEEFQDAERRREAVKRDKRLSVDDQVKRLREIESGCEG